MNDSEETEGEEFETDEEGEDDSAAETEADPCECCEADALSEPPDEDSAETPLLDA